jgi:hypothetical protein
METEGTDPRKLWIQEEIGCRQQKDDPLCRSGMARGTWSRRTIGRTGPTEKSDQGQSCKRNPEMTNAGDEILDAPGRQHSHRNRDLSQELRLRSKRTSGGIYHKIFILEIVKRAAGSFVRLRNIRKWTLWRGQPLPKQKKQVH